MRARPMVIATVKTALNLLDAGSRVRHLPALLPMSETHVPPCERLLGRADRRACVPSGWLQSPTDPHATSPCEEGMITTLTNCSHSVLSVLDDRMGS